MTVTGCSACANVPQLKVAKFPKATGRIPQKWIQVKVYRVFWRTSVLTRRLPEVMRPVLDGLGQVPGLDFVA